MNQNLNKVATTQNNLFNDNNWTVSENQIFLDLKILLDDCFRATMTNVDNCIKLNFDNGQKFIISVTQV